MPHTLTIFAAQDLVYIATALAAEERDARWVYYRLNPETAEAVRTQVAALLDLAGFDATPATCD